MTNWQLKLNKSSIEFVNEIIAQIPENNGIRETFEVILNCIAENVIDADTKFKLTQLELMQDCGVEYWDGMPEVNSRMQDLMDDAEEEEPT